jgi:hypothetical protein
MNSSMAFVAAILKMASARNFSMSGINSGHHNLPTYEMSVKSDNVEFVRYCGGQFEYIFLKKLLIGLKLRAFEKYYYILIKELLHPQFMKRYNVKFSNFQP